MKVIEQEKNGTPKAKCVNEVICIEEGDFHQIFVDEKKTVELAMALLELAGWECKGQVVVDGKSVMSFIETRPEKESEA